MENNEEKKVINVSDTFDVVDVKEIPHETNKKSPWKLFLILLGILSLGLLFWGVIHVYEVYKTASVYKVAYDITQNELDECDKIKGTSQPKERFDYCEMLQQKYKNVERN